MAGSALLARATLLVAALGLGAAACGGGSSKSATTSTSTASSTTSSAPATGPAPKDQAAAKAAIIKDWETFFAGSSGVDTKVSLLQNGSQYRAAIQAGSANPLASSTTAKVATVTFTSPTSATVTYDIESGGKVLLSNQRGTALLVNGTWLVSDTAFCSLLSLQGGQLPPGCPKA